MNAYELADKAEQLKTGEYGYVDGWMDEAANMLRQQADRIAELEDRLSMYEIKDLDRTTPQTNVEPVAWLVDTVITYSDEIANRLSAESGKPVLPLYTTPQTKPLSDADLTLILEVLIDSYDDTNRCYLEYKAMWEKSPTRKARIDGMKRMVDKHANAIEKIEAIIERHGIK